MKNNILSFFEGFYNFCENRFEPIIKICYAKYYGENSPKNQLLIEHYNNIKNIVNHLIDNKYNIFKFLYDNYYFLEYKDEIIKNIFYLIIIGHDLGKSEYSWFENKKDINDENAEDNEKEENILYRHELISCFLMKSAFDEYLKEKNDIFTLEEKEIIRDIFNRYILIPILLHHGKTLFVEEVSYSDIDEKLKTFTNLNNIQQEINFLSNKSIFACDKPLKLIQPHRYFTDKNLSINDLYKNNEYISKINFYINNIISNQTLISDEYSSISQLILDLFNDSKKNFNLFEATYIKFLLWVFQTLDYMSSGIYGEEQFYSIIEKIEKYFSKDANNILQQRKEERIDKNFQPNDDQQVILSEIAKKNYYTYIINIATGGGKTLTGAWIAEKQYPNKYVLLVTPTRTLAKNQQVFFEKDINDIFDEYAQKPENILEFLMNNAYNTITEDRLYLIFTQPRYHLVRLFIITKCVIIFDEVHDVFSNSDNDLRIKNFYMLNVILTSLDVPKIFLSATLSQKIIKTLTSISKKYSCTKKDIYVYKSKNNKKSTNKKIKKMKVTYWEPLTFSNNLLYPNYPNYKIYEGYCLSLIKEVEKKANKNESVAVVVNSKKNAIALKNLFERILNWKLGREIAVLCSKDRCSNLYYNNYVEPTINRLISHRENLINNYKNLSLISFPEPLKCLIIVLPFVKFGINFTVQHMYVEAAFPHEITQIAGRINRGQSGNNLIDPEKCSLIIMPNLTIPETKINFLSQRLNIDYFKKYKDNLNVYKNMFLNKKILCYQNIFSKKILEDSLNRSTVNSFHPTILKHFKINDKEKLINFNILELFINIKFLTLINDNLFLNDIYDYLWDYYGVFYRYCDGVEHKINDDLILRNIPEYIKRKIINNGIPVDKDLGI